MKYQLNTLIATIKVKSGIPAGAVGVILGFNEEQGNTQYFIEIFAPSKFQHKQLFYTADEIYAIQQ